MTPVWFNGRRFTINQEGIISHGTNADKDLSHADYFEAVVKARQYWLNRWGYQAQGLTCVYVMFRPDEYKIGYSDKPYTRSVILKANLIHCIPFATRAAAYQFEQALHRYFGDCRNDGEWFALAPQRVEALTKCSSSRDLEHMMRGY